MIVLATTDDGYESESFRALLAAARRWGGEECRVLGAAPAEDMSGVGASQTAGSDVRVAGGDGGDLFALHGTPADCVEWALSENSPLDTDALRAGYVTVSAFEVLRPRQPAE